jgi:iron(III) transport system permease protein
VNTLIFALSTAVVALGIGTSVAWLVERTTLPGKTAVYTLMTVGLILPSMFLAMGWVFLLNPRIGMLNAWLRGLVGGEFGPVNIATPVGMGWVEGLALAPVAFIMTAETFRAMDSSIEEAAEVHGLRYPAVMRWITLPLTRPGLLAAFIVSTHLPGPAPAVRRG